MARTPRVVEEVGDQTGSDEFFREDEEGNRTDADLHDELLSTEDAEDEQVLEIRDRLLAEGEDPELVDLLWPL